MVESTLSLTSICSRSVSNKLPQHRAESRNAFADVFLARVAEADAHFVIRFAPGRVGGVTNFARHIEHVVFQRGLKNL